MRMFRELVRVDAIDAERESISSPPGDGERQASPRH
jgi:hypothetical protein